MHNVEELCKCKGSGKAFELTQHQQIHSGQKQHECKKCGKFLKLTSSLIWHHQIHNGERPSEGEVCGKHLDIVQPILNIREFILERNFVNAHGKAFGHSSSFTKHPRIHSGEKLYEIRNVGMHLVWVSTFLNIEHMY